MNDEPNAKVSFEKLTSNALFEFNTNKHMDNGNGFTHDNVYITANSNNSLTGDILRATYTNIQNSKYNEIKIGKIVATYSNLISFNAKTQKNQPVNPMLQVWSNPQNGFWYLGSSVTVKYQLYDTNGNLINLNNDSQAWITVGSLNSGAHRTEGAQLLSSGKTYGFKGSTVTVHNGNWLYSDGVNEITVSGKPTWGEPNGLGNSFVRNLSPNEKDWDAGLNSPLAYKGAGVFNVNGNNFTIKYTTIHNDKYDRHTWATFSTSIVKSNSGIIPPTLHYHHTNVALQH